MKIHIVVIALLALVVQPCFSQENPFAAKARQVFPSHDGEFSAMLMVIASQDLREFDKPSEQGLHLTKVSKVKRGNSLALKIGFAGMRLDKNSMVDVTYDLKLLDPDGKVTSDDHDLVGLRGKVEAAHRLQIFDNQNLVQIVFEPSDKKGKYKFIGEIRDNIGNKRIPLEAEVELVD